MRKIRFHTIILIVTYVLLPIIMILMLHNISLSNVLTKMGGDGLGSRQENICVQEEDDKKEIINCIKNEKASIALYAGRQTEDGITVRQIYFNNEYENLPIKKGRFFKKEDFRENNNVAVVGKNLEKLIYTENGKEYIDIENVKFSVIGVYGYEDDTFFDTFVFVNMLSDINEERTVFTLDFLSKGNLADDITERIINNLNEKNIEASLMSATEGDYLSNSVPQLNFGIWFIVLLLCCFFCILAASLQWFSAKRKSIAIKLLIGATRADVMKELTLQYVVMTAISFIIGLLYGKLMYFGYLKFLIAGYAMLGVFIIIFLIIIYMKLKNIKIAEGVV